MPRRGVVLAAVLLALVACVPSTPQPQSCRKAQDCSAREYCAQPIGGCDAPGTCRPRPEICLQLYSPVCGCDGAEYGNACKAAAYGASVERADTCPGD
jgi:hypothetical protein